MAELMATAACMQLEPLTSGKVKNQWLRMPAFPFPFLFSPGCVAWCYSLSGWVFGPQLNLSVSNITDMPRGMSSQWFQIQSSWLSLSITHTLSVVLWNWYYCFVGEEVEVQTQALPLVMAVARVIIWPFVSGLLGCLLCNLEGSG